VKDVRTKITTDVQKVIARYGLRLRGSWLYGEQHFVVAQDKLFSLSDIDIISDAELANSSEESLRAEIADCTRSTLLVSPAISIRNAVIGNSASQVTDHNTLFWSYIALFELKHVLHESAHNNFCDTESYFLNKFLLNIWRNLLLDTGKLPTSYSSILDMLDNLSDDDKKGLLSIKKGECPTSTARPLIQMFYEYTTAWVKINCRVSIRHNLLEILEFEANKKDYSFIFEKLKKAAISETEFGVVAYSQAKVGLGQ
jgi:hypothetical protein